MSDSTATSGQVSHTPDTNARRRELSVVVPAFNEEENVDLVHQRLTETLKAYGKTYEIVFVEDGSTDRTFELLKSIHERDPAVRVIRFARNFGQQMAIAAGLRYAYGDVVVLIDADMQTLPEEIPMLVDKLAEGYDIVYGVRQHRRDPWWRRLGSRAVSYMVCRVTGIEVPDSSSAFIALDRRFVDHINLYHEKTKYFSGLFAWLSYGRCGVVPVTHAPRQTGVTKYNFRKLVAGTLNFICNFTVVPLDIALYCGALVIALSVLGFAGLLTARLLGTAAPQETTWFLVAVIAFFSGTQLFSVGILGQYLGRTYHEVKERPAFVIREVLEPDERRQA